MAGRTNATITAIAKAVIAFSNSAKDPLTGESGVEIDVAYDSLKSGLANDKVRLIVLKNVVDIQNHVPKPRQKKA